MNVNPGVPEVCNLLDDDCDGEVDEGVVNACGTCPPEPCFTETWDTPSDCAVPERFTFRFDRRRTAGEVDWDGLETLYQVVPWPLLSWDIGYDPNVDEIGRASCRERV